MTSAPTKPRVQSVLGPALLLFAATGNAVAGGFGDRAPQRMRRHDGRIDDRLDRRH